MIHELSDLCETGKKKQTEGKYLMNRRYYCNNKNMIINKLFRNCSITANNLMFLFLCKRAPQNIVIGPAPPSLCRSFTLAHFFSKIETTTTTTNGSNRFNQSSGTTTSSGFWLPVRSAMCTHMIPPKQHCIFSRSYS